MAISLRFGLMSLRLLGINSVLIKMLLCAFPRAIRSDGGVKA